MNENISKKIQSIPKPSAEVAAKSKIVIERTYEAHVEDLWELWTTKEGFESWWGPKGFRAEVHTIAPKLNGKLHYNMIAETPEIIESMKQLGLPASHPERATFAEFKPYERLQLTHIMDYLPGVKPYDSTVLVEFFQLGAAVKMVTTIHPQHNEQFTQMAAEAFTNQLTKLDGRLKAQQVVTS